MAGGSGIPGGGERREGNRPAIKRPPAGPRAGRGTNADLLRAGAPATGEPDRGGRAQRVATAPDLAAETGMFRRWTASYAAERPGQQVAVLLAGAVTAAGDLGLGELQDSGTDLTVTLVDDDQPVTRAARDAHPGLSRCTLGDLRMIPLPPRSYDIVACTLLLDRIRHPELVLDRLVEAVKPGGLVLLQIRDRDSAAGFLDRMLPGWLRAPIWRQHRPGRPGPHPAVYERLGSVRGIQSYALLRGLVVAERQALGGLAGGLPAAPGGYLAAQRAVAWMSGHRLTADHEECLYVLRKPENQFARIL